MKDYYKRGYVYFLWKDTELVYVGASLRRPTQRLEDHKRTKDFDTADVIAVDRFARHEVEEFYIQRHQPRYNNKTKTRAWDEVHRRRLNEKIIKMVEDGTWPTLTRQQRPGA